MCISVDSLFTTTEALIGSVETVLGSVELAIPNPIIVAIETASGIALTGVEEVKKLYDDYEADNTKTGIIGDIQAAITAVQNDIQGIETAAHVDNKDVQAFISKVVNLAGNVMTDVVNDILPAINTVHTTGSISLAQAKSISQSFKQVKNSAVLQWDAALANSGLPATVIKAVHDDFHHKIARHIGPVRI